MSSLVPARTLAPRPFVLVLALVLGSVLQPTSVARAEEPADPAAAALDLNGDGKADPIERLDLPAPADKVVRGVFIDPLRYRHEFRDDNDLDRTTEDRENRDFFKLGFGIDSRPVDPVRARMALRLTRSWGRDHLDRRAAFDAFGQDHLDLFEGFGELGPLEGVPLSVRVGRQVLVHGEERLVGPLEFVQNARSFDAAKVLWKTDDLAVDAWWGRLVQFRGYDDKNFNTPIETTDFFGVYGSWKPIEDLTVEPYYLGKLDDNREIVGEQGRVGHYLLLHGFGGRFVWKPLPFILWGDVIYETGKSGPDPIEAYGLVGKAAFRAPEGLRPFFEVETEFAYGSGDRDPTDGRRETLDNFYPTNHKFYGEIDFVSWQNIQSWRLTSRFELYRIQAHEPPPARPKDAPPPHLGERVQERLPAEIPVMLEVSWHFFWLASATDAWFNAGLRPLRRDPTGGATRELGEELDVVLRMNGVAFAYAHFFPGTYIDRTTPPGGRSTGADLFYFELSFSF